MAVEDFALFCQDAFAVSLVVQELSVVAASVWVLGLPFAVWKVVLPLAFVLVSVDIKVLAMPVCYVILEIPFIIASIRLDPSSSAFAPPILELALQKVSIVKVQLSVTTSFVFVHLPNVFGIQMAHVFLLIVLRIVIGGLKTWQVVQTGNDGVAFYFTFVDSRQVADPALD
jgi:hypothetical protein